MRALRVLVALALIAFGAVAFVLFSQDRRIASLERDRRAETIESFQDPPEEQGLTLEDIYG